MIYLEQVSLIFRHTMVGAHISSPRYVCSWHCFLSSGLNSSLTPLWFASSTYFKNSTLISCHSSIKQLVQSSANLRITTEECGRQVHPPIHMYLLSIYYSFLRLQHAVNLKLTQCSVLGHGQGQHYCRKFISELWFKVIYCFTYQVLTKIVDQATG